MPTEVWIALITLTAGALGYFARPLTDLVGVFTTQRVKDRVDRRQRQLDTLLELSRQLRDWINGPAPVSHMGKFESERLVFQVDDPEVRKAVELLMVQSPNSQAIRDQYGNVIRMVGAAIRAL